MFQPKRTKFFKQRKGSLGGIENRSTNVAFGIFGLVSEESGRITSRQIEASRKTIKRRLKRLGSLWIRIFPDIPVTSKPTEVRMGKGKGSIDYWCCKVETGKILFELSGVSLELAREAFKLASDKLPVRTKFVIASSS